LLRQSKECNFFEKLLANDHIPKWHEICANVCDEHTHVDLEGVRCDRRLRRNFASLKHCYLQVLLTVTKQDAVERMHRYISTTVKMADEVKVVQLINRMKELNTLVPYLPCLKHREGSPDKMPSMDESFSELEMCTNILAALSSELSMAYWASKGEHFPTDLRKLKEDLVLVETQVCQQERLLDELRVKVGMKPKSKQHRGKEHQEARMKSLGDRIPKKSFKTAQVSTPKSGGKSKWVQKLCQHCATWSPHSKHTHDTKDCRKWNKDGTPKGDYGHQGKGKTRSVNMHQEGDDEAEVTAAYNKLRKQHANMMKREMKKACKKHKKRGKKRRYFSDFSDLSDDDSE